jgi:hypothetical protein
MRSMVSRGTRAAVTLLLLAGAVRAGMPQPGFIFYGQARDEQGWPYLSDAEVVLKVNGQVCASHVITGAIRPGVNFVLRVPLDSGVGTAYSAVAARPGDPVSIVVRAGGGDKPIMDPFPLPDLGSAGGVLGIDVTVGTDADHDGLPDEWEQWLVDYDGHDAVTSIASVRPGEDFDGDGVSNLEEFRSGTFAELEYDYFRIESVDPAAADKICLAFLSVPGKAYTLSVVSNVVAGGWSPCAVATNAAGPFAEGPVEGTGDFMFLHVEKKSPQSYYRLEVR